MLQEQVQPYTIKLYSDAYADSLATMWNESDEQWPGTFTDGVPMTAERVVKWMKKEPGLLLLIVVTPLADGSEKVVAFGSLWDEPNTPGTAYVELLNVHPEYQGKSLCRRMLQQMVDWSVENDVPRLTIGTWSGNLKSVPLYKKVGFYWIPGADVDMESYVPMLRMMPLGAAYFERHDWYRTYVRTLDQTPDEERHPHTGDTPIYINRWEAGDELLEAVICRQGLSLLGLENENFAIHAYAENHKPATGLTNSFYWRVENKCNRPLSLSLAADADEHISIEASFTKQIAPNSVEILEASFICSADAPPLDPGKPWIPNAAPHIWSNVTLDGNAFQLGTGIFYQPAIEVSIEPELPLLTPAVASDIALTLRNRTERRLVGELTLDIPAGLTLTCRDQQFDLEADGEVTLSLRATVEKSGSYPFGVSCTFDDRGQQAQTGVVKQLLLAPTLGDVMLVEHNDKLRGVNDHFTIEMARKGGELKLHSTTLAEHDLLLSAELIPPTEPFELNGFDHEWKLVTANGVAIIRSSVASRRFAGLILHRSVKIGGSSLITVQFEVENRGDVVHTFKLQPDVRYNNWSDADVIVPRTDYIVREKMVEFLNHGDVPEQAADMAEPWIAFEKYGHVAAFVWNEQAIEQEMWRARPRPIFTEQTVAPGETFSYAPTYLILGSGDWRFVQHVWQRVQGAAPRPIHNGAREQAASPYQITLNNVISDAAEIDALLSVSSLRQTPLSGIVMIEPPDGWHASQSSIAVSKLVQDSPLSETVSFKSDDAQPGAHRGELRFVGEQFDRVVPFDLFYLGNGNRPVTTKENEDRTWSIHNGFHSWRIAPAFNAGVIEWTVDGHAQNQLSTSYPEPGVLSWLTPWLGGIRPILWPKDPNFATWPGDLHKASFTPTPIETTDEIGLNWFGISLATRFTEERLRDVTCQIDYLTLGDSNVLQVATTLSNESAAFRKLTSGQIAFFDLDGGRDEAVVHGPAIQRKRMPGFSIQKSGRWGAVENPATGRAVSVVTQSRNKEVQVMDWGVAGGHLYAMDGVVLGPAGTPTSTVQIQTYYALCDTLAEAMRYGELIR